MHVARRGGSEAGSERGGAKKSSELRQPALAGQLAQRGSGDRATHLTSYLHLWSQDEADRSGCAVSWQFGWS